MGEQGTYCPKCGKFGATVEVVTVNDEVSMVVTQCAKCGTRFEWAKFRPGHAAEDLSLRSCPVCGASNPKIREAENEKISAVEYTCSNCSFRVVLARKKPKS
jgi:RNase P subunit RPR2